MSVKFGVRQVPGQEIWVVFRRPSGGIAAFSTEAAAKSFCAYLDSLELAEEDIRNYIPPETIVYERFDPPGNFVKPTKQLKPIPWNGEAPQM